MYRCFLILHILVALSWSVQTQYVELIPVSQASQVVYANGSLLPSFDWNNKPSQCCTSQLFVYEQTPEQLQQNTAYKLVINNLFAQQPISAHAKYDSFEPSLSQTVCSNNCVISIQNNCPVNVKFATNLFTIDIGSQISLSYKVNCNNSYYFKPFEWGLFLLIFTTSVVITASSFYSRAWSYGGIGIDIDFKAIIVFDVAIIVVSIVASLSNSQFLPILADIVGTILGIMGVVVCTNEFLWVFKKRQLNNKKIWRNVRAIDVVSICTGLVMGIIYWATSKNWISTDILSVCLIVASIKLFKLTSLRIAFYLLGSVLLIEIVFGLIVHYVAEVSYNNLIINKYNSPLLVELPSITPELYRNCSWLPVTSLILPGLLLSYLRRFDVSRNTYLYLLLGYVSLYLGSVLWMVVDMSTPHTLPFAIISDPATVLTILIFAYKRNELKTLWNGHFYDPEINIREEGLILDRNHAQRYTELVKDLAIYHQL